MFKHKKREREKEMVVQKQVEKLPLVREIQKE